MADVSGAADDIRSMVQNWFDANDLDQTLENLHEFPRAIQEAFSALADQLRENSNLAERIPDAVQEAAGQMTGIAESLQEALGFGVQRS